MSHLDRWGTEAEIDFVQELGTHRPPGHRDGSISYGERLRMYITAHEPSPHPHHRAGVLYARAQLEYLEDDD